MVHGLFEGRAGAARLLFEKPGDVVVKRESCSHIMMIFRKHHDVNKLMLAASFERQAKPDGLRHHRLIFLVRALEIRDLMIAFEVPNSCGHFVNQVFVVRDQENGSVIAL